ncbi:MAG: hypothetical protein Fur0018_11110 [Anaerolineales bacterium]
MSIFGRYETQFLIRDDGITQIYAAQVVEGDLLEVRLVRFPAYSEADREMYIAAQRTCALAAEIEGVPLVPVLDYGITAEGFFYVLPAWSDHTLTQRLQRGVLSWEETVFVVQRVAQALDALHAAGIVHGDLKPAHIHFDAQGRAFLGGVGHRNALRVLQQAWPGTVSGPVGYRSPEQDLPGAAVTPACDVYALGVIAYQMLSGQLPFTAHNTLGWHTQHLFSPVPDVRSLRTDVPENTARSLRVAMHKNPAARFDSAGAFAQAFSGLQAKDSKHLVHEDDAYWTRYLAGKQRHAPAWAALLLGVVMLLASLGVWGVYRSVALFAPARRLTATPLALAEVPATMTMTASPTATIPPTGSPPPTEEPRPSPTATVGSVFHGETSSPTATVPPAPQVALPSQGTATPTSTAPPEVPPIINTPLPGGTYKIGYGDNLFGISAALGLNQGQFMGANSLSCNSRLYPGKSLLVPPPGIAQYTFPNVMITSRNITALQSLYVPECVHDVGDVAFSPDGQVLAIAQQNDVLLWLVSEWRPLRVLAAHRVPVTRLRYAPDGSLLVSAGKDGSVFVWQAADGMQVHTFRAHGGEITDMTFSPHGEWLVTTSLDQHVALWQAVDWSKTNEIKGYAAYSAAFSPDGSLLAVGFSDKVSLIDMHDFHVVRNLPAQSVPHNLTFSLDGILLASNSDLWQVSDGRHIYHWPETTHRIAFTADGLGLLVGQKIWRIDNGLALGSLELDIDQTARTAYAMDSVAFSSDYRMLAVGTQDGVVVLGLPASAQIAANQNPVYRLLPGDNYMNVAAAFDVPLAGLLDVNKLTCEHEPFISQALTIPTAQAPWAPSLLPIYPENLSQIRRLITLGNRCAQPRGRIVFSPAGDTLVSGIGLWSLRMGSLLVQGTDLSQMPLDASTVMPDAVLQFSPDGRLVAEPRGGDILFWGAADGRWQRTIPAHDGRITTLAFDMSGQILASSSIDKTIHLWRVSDGTLLDTIPGYVAERLIFTPDGKTLVSVAGDTARFWPIAIQGSGAQTSVAVLNKESGEPRFTFQGLHWAYHLSPNGEYMGYVTCLDGTPAHCNQQVLSLFSVTEGVIKHTFPGVKNIIQDFAFSPDSTQVAIATENAILVWDINSEKSVVQLLGDRKYAEYIDTLFYTPDGKMILTMVNQSFLRFWEIPSGREAGKVSTPGIRFVTMSADQYMLAILVDNDVTLWGAGHP